MNNTKGVIIDRDDIEKIYPELSKYKELPTFSVLVDIVHFVLYKTFTHKTRKKSMDLNISILAIFLKKNRKSVSKYLLFLEEIGVFFAVETFSKKEGGKLVRRTQVIRNKHEYENIVSLIKPPEFINEKSSNVELTNKTQISDFNDFKLKKHIIPHLLIKYNKNNEEDILKDSNALADLIKEINVFEKDPDFRGRWMPNSKYLSLIGRE